jgi:hypothetical protein
MENSSLQNTAKNFQNGKGFLEDFEFSELHPPSILKSKLAVYALSFQHWGSINFFKN